MSEDLQHLSGRCLCGACGFDLIGPANWVGHCHCESCRRATASAMTTWIGQENGRWRFTGVAPQLYQSSPGRRRGFCGTCGSPIFYESDAYPNERHFYAALLDDPDAVLPVAQYHTSERVRWVYLAGAVPCR
jgi:hypothetical protein